MGDKVLCGVSHREKTIVFFYVLILFLVFSAVAAFILFFANSEHRFAEGKREALEQMGKVESFRRAQQSAMTRILFVDSRVAKVDPGLNASYEKREISFALGEIRKLYVQNKHDDRYRIFDYVALFYELRIFDKERLWTSQKNIEMFKADLERCRSGIESKKLNSMQ